MKVVIATVASLAATAALAQNGDAIRGAMKEIGPAFMCGAPYEYGEALGALESTMVEAGVPGQLAKYSIEGLDKFVREQHAAKRETITASECAEKYGRG